MDKSELTLTGEEVDLSKYIEDAGGIHGLRDVDKVEVGIISNTVQGFQGKIHLLLPYL